MQELAVYSRFVPGNGLRRTIHHVPIAGDFQFPNDHHSISATFQHSLFYAQGGFNLIQTDISNCNSNIENDFDN